MDGGSPRPMRSRRVALAAAAAALVTLVLPAAPGLAAGRSLADGDPLIVRVRDGAAVASTVAADVDGALGRRVMPGMWRVRVPRGTADHALARMRGDHRVQWAERDGTVRIAVTPNDPCFDDPSPECGDTSRPRAEQWGMRKVNAPAAWDITRGSEDVLVAVLDTGVNDQHPDLMSKVFVGGNYSGSPTDADVIGHGTHVAGTAAAETDNVIGVAGLGWNTPVLSIKVHDDVGEGEFSGVAEAIHEAIAAGAEVINMSFAAPTFSSAIR